MQIIKNAIGKTVCRIDAAHRIVEIVHKGMKTTIIFLEDGQVRIENATTD